MDTFKRNIVLLIIGLMFLCSNVNIAYASKIEFYKSSIAEVDKVNFYNLTTKDGLSNNIITDIYQDSLGYIWIGTEDGLNQYNGNIVIEYNYETNNESSLTSTCITSINEDDHGNIWVGTDAGLNIINRTDYKVTMIEENEGSDNILSDYVITSIYRDSNDTMWVGTANGLNRYDEKNNKFIKYYTDGTDKSINNNHITDIDEDNNGYLWISTIDGISAIDLNTYDIHNWRNGTDNTEFIYQVDRDSEGNMWVVTKNDIFQVTAGKYELGNYKIDIGDNLSKDVTKVLCDSKGDVWFSSSSGLIRYIPSTNITKIYQSGPSQSNYLLSNSIRCLYEDRNGVLWIGTNNGISILNVKQRFSNKINNILKKNEIYVSSITSFLEDSESDLWIGTEQNGVIYFDVDENKMIRFSYNENDKNSLSSNSIKYIAQGKPGVVIVTTDNGINTIDKETGDVIKQDVEDATIIPFNQDLKMINDGKDLWVATHDGLYRSANNINESENYKEHFIESGIENYKVFDIYQDDNDENILWLAGGRGGGLIKFHKTKGIIKNYLSSSENNSLSYESINCIQGDEKGNLWIGTDSGLNKFNIKEETFTKYSEKHGLGSNYINSIIVDNNEDIWLGTSNGLSKFILSENRFINFTEVDGIYGNQFNKRAAYKTKEGYLLFGTTKGVVSFNPDDIEKVISKEDKIILDKVLVNNDLYTIKEKNVELKYNENNITIQYFIPDYTRIGGITYFYKMDGVNDEWISGNSDGYAHYTMLKPGNYTFRVKASNSDGSLTEASSINFVIKKPFWQSNIAYCIYISLISILILFFIYHVRILKSLVDKQTKEINSQMEENKKLYERNIRNEKFKNDYFVNLSHELRTPINVILSVVQLFNSLDESGSVTKEKVLYYMNVIMKNSNNLLNIINDIIDSSKIESGTYKINKQENIDIVYLVEETALNMSNYINNKGIDLIIDPEIEEMPICCDPKEIERCVINLIGNAVKFTESGGEIKVLIKEYENNVSISIADTGLGISNDDQEFIFKRFEQGKSSNSTQVSSSGIGLTLVKYIVELHGGQVTLESEINKGSTFTIILPIS
ncbi:sensor histidine kinase [Clostridium sp.]|uniref:ligand-binding sensor domain-containing protein n=1 Tax=Clostridium sp. TaxID=1506 RepID=UPI0025C6D9B9|nr:sensor histidine kinase [Clostridium sp.]